MTDADGLPLLVVCCYTPAYAGDAELLRADLESIGLKHEISGVPCEGSWRANCYHRVWFLLEMLERFGRRHRLIWLDADTRARRYPDLLEHLDCDFAAFWSLGDEGPPEIQGGTMYFQDRLAVRELLRRWGQTRDDPSIRRSQQGLDQIVFQMAVIERTLAVRRLPPTYNCALARTKAMVAPSQRVFEHEHFGSAVHWGI